MRLLGLEEMIYGLIDDLFCILSFFGSKPVWYREWWNRS